MLLDKFYVESFIIWQFIIFMTIRFLRHFISVRIKCQAKKCLKHNSLKYSIMSQIITSINRMATHATGRSHPSFDINFSQSITSMWGDKEKWSRPPPQSGACMLKKSNFTRNGRGEATKSVSQEAENISRYQMSRSWQKESHRRNEKTDGISHDWSVFSFGWGEDFHK